VVNQAAGLFKIDPRIDVRVCNAARRPGLRVPYPGQVELAGQELFYFNFF
jgi:hypothetical protein